RGIEADADDVGELPFDATLQLDALIVDVVVRVLPVPDAETGKHAADRSGFETALGFQRRALGAPPCERHREPLASTEQVDGTDPSAIRESIAVGIAQDGKEHQAVPEPAP